MAFDDQGNRVGVVEFQYPDAEAPEDSDVARARREVIVRLLQCLCDRASARQAGQRAILLAYLTRAGGCRTQKDLARQLGVTPGRVSQALKSIRREFAMLSRG